MENKELIELNKKIEGLVLTIAEQSSEIKKIREALIGNEFGKEQGIVNQLSTIDERVSVLEKKWNNTYWFILGAGAVAGVTVGKFISVLVKAFGL